jgi:hypothetical protein
VRPENSLKIDEYCAVFMNIENYECLGSVLEEHGFGFSLL